MPKLHLSDKERLGRHENSTRKRMLGNGQFIGAASRIREKHAWRKIVFAPGAMWAVHNGQTPPGADAVHRCDQSAVLQTQITFLGMVIWSTSAIE